MAKCKGCIMVKCIDCINVRRYYPGSFKDNLCWCNKTGMGYWSLNKKHLCRREDFEEGASLDTKKEIAEIL